MLVPLERLIIRQVKIMAHAIKEANKRGMYSEVRKTSADHSPVPEEHAAGLRTRKSIDDRYEKLRKRYPHYFKRQGSGTPASEYTRKPKRA